MTEITINIRKYRKEKGLSQSDLAEQLNVTRQTVSSWENGKTYPDLDMVVQLSEVLGTDPNHLLYPEAEKKQKSIDGVSLKWTLLVMVVFYLLMTFGIPLYCWLFELILGGGIQQSYLYPIFGGIVFLAGLVAVCTTLIIEEVRMLKIEDEDEDE
jgi:transcriptional regulator with XRE-family HTH domain